jgi:hypothetical protein
MAWLFHIPVCWVTVWVYGFATLQKVMGYQQSLENREKWQK